MVELGLREAFLAQDVCIEPPWQVLAQLVVHVCTSWDAEDVVEFFESALFGLWHPEEAIFC